MPYIQHDRNVFLLFVCVSVCLLSVIRCKLWQILGTHEHWTVRVLNWERPTVTRDIRLYRHLRGPVAMKLTPLAWRLALGFKRLGSVAMVDRTPISCMNALPTEPSRMYMLWWTLVAHICNINVSYCYKILVYFVCWKNPAIEAWVAWFKIKIIQFLIDL